MQIKLTIGKKLLLGISLMLILIAVISAVGFSSINRLEETTEEMMKESLEIDAIQALRLSFQELLMPVNDYLIHGGSDKNKKFKDGLAITKKQAAMCRKLVGSEHEKIYLDNFEKSLSAVETLTKKIMALENPIGNPKGAKMMEEMDAIVIKAISELNEIQMEAREEMKQYITINQTTNTQRKRIILLCGIAILFVLLFGGFFFVRGITKQISRLELSTQKVSSGDLSATAKVTAHDEIGKLAESFNKMIGVLEQTTVSREYFNNILSRMADTLIITDPEGKIKIANQAAQRLLGYTEKELLGKPIGMLLVENNNNKDTLSTDKQAGLPKSSGGKQAFTYNSVMKALLEKKHVDNVYNTYYSKTGRKIPVLFSASMINDTNGLMKGMICIANHSIEEEPQEYQSDIAYSETLDESAENSNRSRQAGFDREETEIQHIKTIGEIPLTKREKEIMKHIAEEYSNREIADKLFISVRTVETHRKNIMQKLHTKSVIALVKYAFQNGIISVKNDT